jgi:hypothetical protein
MKSLLLCLGILLIAGCATNSRTAEATLSGRVIAVRAASHTPDEKNWEVWLLRPRVETGVLDMSTFRVPPDYDVFWKHEPWPTWSEEMTGTREFPTVLGTNVFLFPIGDPSALFDLDRPLVHTFLRGLIGRQCRLTLHDGTVCKADVDAEYLSNFSTIFK